MDTMMNFVPKTMKLFGDDDDNKHPDISVTVLPATWRAHEQRRDILVKEGVTFLDQQREEIWLTFGGTNMDVTVSDPAGEWTKDDAGNYYPPTREVRFKHGMSREDFMEQIMCLPVPVVNAWWWRVVEVNPDWAPNFRRD